QSGVFTAAALAVVVIADDDPLQAMGFIVPGDLRNGLSALTRDHILSLASLIREGIGSAHEHIIAELVQMTAVAQPRASRGDMVGGGLSLGLDQYRHVEEVLTVPGRPWLQQLQPLTVRGHGQRDIAAILRRRDIGGVPSVEVLGRYFWSRLGRLQLEGLAIGS